ncbi:glutaredoxin [Roseobacter sp. A03A-229]
MFGFEWCEFCWSIRRLFDAAGVPFRAVDVDTAHYRKDDWGGEVLRALFARTEMRTVPQVFIGGTLVGGASDVLAGFGTGKVQALLAALPHPIHAQAVPDPMQFLPKWVGRPAPQPATTEAGRCDTKR